MAISRQRVGAIYLVLSSAAGLACLRLLWGSSDNLLQFFAAIACGAAAYFLGSAGNRRRVPVFRDVETVASLASKHDIPVAVYLRRFHEDVHSAGTSSEEEIALGLGSHALFVAIGRPGEELPTQGAFRLYVSDEQWRDVVQALLSIASLIFLRWAPGGHLGWELDQVAQEEKLHRTAFVVPRLLPGVDLPDFLPQTVSERIDIEELQTRLEESPALLTLQEDGTVSLLRLQVEPDDQDWTPLERMASAFADNLSVPSLDRKKAIVMRRLYGRTERVVRVVGAISVTIPSVAVLLGGVLILDAFTPFDIIPLSWDLDRLLSILGGLVLASIVVAILGSLLISKLTGRS